MKLSQIELAIDVLKKNENAFETFSKELRNNKEVVLCAVKQRGVSLLFASNKLKNDKEVVLEAVNNDGISLAYASEALREDKEVVLAAIKANAIAIKYASEDFKKNKDIVREAIKSHPLSIFFVSSEFKDDMEILGIIKEWLVDNKNKILSSQLASLNVVLERLKELEILEEDTWMRENNPVSSQKNKTRKF